MEYHMRMPRIHVRDMACVSKIKHCVSSRHFWGVVAITVLGIMAAVLFIWAVIQATGAEDTATFYPFYGP